jgi:levansucrase
MNSMRVLGPTESGQIRNVQQEAKARMDGVPTDVAWETAAWTAEQVRRIAAQRGHTAPLIRAGDFARISPEIDLWDAWPVQEKAGNPARLEDGATLWMALCAPHSEDPDERHGLARIHLFQHDAHGFSHLGPVFPEGFTPGSREWSGSAVLGADGRSLAIYFTAAGVKGEAEQSYTQRLFSARAMLEGANGNYRFGNWHQLEEFVCRDPAWYMATDGGAGSVGTIKAFRDPAFFHDPRSGLHYVFFAASQAGSHSAYNGVIGAAVSAGSEPGDWQVQEPLLSANGLNNELERPHVVLHGGLYYLFWSTQAHVFDPAGPIGPTGLYGMVSDRIERGWQPLNGTGLVFANPPEAPAQAYSWLVLPDLSVISFVDNWGQSADALPRRFGASFAPRLRLRLDRSEAMLGE